MCDELENRLNAEFGEADWFWDNDSDSWVCNQTYVPTWKVRPEMHLSGRHYFAVTYILGSYRQECEASNLDELIDLMHAMEDACENLNQSMRKAWEARSVRTPA